MSHRLFHAVRRLGLPRLGIAATLIGAIACGDAGTGPRTPTNPTGLYGLFTVDRASIPTEIFRGTYYDQASGQSFRNFSVRVTGGEIILQEDGSFHLAVDISWATDTQTGTGTKYTDGTWEVRGSEIGLTNQVGTLVGSLRSGAITVPMDVAGSGTLKQYYFRLAT